jgi:TolB protein
LLGEGSWPRWSPDGQRLVFRRIVNKRGQLFTIDAASGTGLVQLTNGDASFDDPSYSPDGRFVVFSSNLGANNKPGYNAWNIYLVRTDGTGLTQLTDGDSLSQQPHWGADGFVYFASNQAGNSDIWRLKPVGEFAASATPAVATP